MNAYLLIVFAFELRLPPPFHSEATILVDVFWGEVLFVYAQVLAQITLTALRLVHDRQARLASQQATSSRVPHQGFSSARIDCDAYGTSAQLRPPAWAAVCVGIGAVASTALLASVLHTPSVEFEYTGLLAPYIDAYGSEWTRGANRSLTSHYSLGAVPTLVRQRITNDPAIRDHLVFWTWALPIVAPALVIGLCMLLALLWGVARRPMASATWSQWAISRAHRSLQLLAPWSYIDAFALALLILVPDMATVAHFIFDEGHCPTALTSMGAGSCLEIRGQLVSGTWLLMALAVLTIGTAQFAIVWLRPRW